MAKDAVAFLYKKKSLTNMKCELFTNFGCDDCFSLF